MYNYNGSIPEPYRAKDIAIPQTILRISLVVLNRTRSVARLVATEPKSGVYRGKAEIDNSDIHVFRSMMAK